MCVVFYFETRIHSSRVLTARSLTASPSIRGGACVAGGRMAGVGHAWQREGACIAGGDMHGRGRVHGMQAPPVNRMTDRQV